MKLAVSFCVVGTLALFAGTTRAQYISSNTNLPPAGSSYLGQYHQWNVPGVGPVRLMNPIHSGFSTSTPAPVGLGVVGTDAFSSTLQGLLMVNGAAVGPITGSGPVSVMVTNLGPDLSGGTTYHTQMTQLDLTANTPLGPAHVRIDPTIPSTGTTTIDPIGGGQFRITSFFDIFTDLSLDGGNTWIPSSGDGTTTLPGGTRMTINPAPGTAALLGLGGVFAGRRRRR